MTIVTRPLLVAVSSVAVVAWLTHSSAALAQEVRVQDSSGADNAALVARVTQELAPLHASGTVTVVLDRAAATLRVRFEPESGAPVEREVALPEDEGEEERAVVYLAYNLASDQTAELLRELHKPKSPPPAPSPAQPATPETPTTQAPKTTDPCDSAGERWPVALALFSPLGSPTRPVDARASFNLLYGDVYRMGGGNLGTVTRVRCDATGGVLTAGGAIVGRNATGALVSSGFNVVRGSTDGLALSFAVNVHTAPLRGFSTSSVVVATDEVRGAQAAFANVGGTQVYGAQLGLVNIGGGVTGSQVGLVNVARSLQGAQVGLVNVTGQASGAQVGLVNVAREVDAAVAGLVSISWAHHIRPLVWTSNITTLQPGVMFEGKRMYCALNFGRFASVVTNGDFVASAELGVRAYRSEDEGFLWDISLGSDSNAGIGKGRALDVFRLGTRVGYRVAPRFAPFAYGGGALVSPTQEAPPDANTLILKPEFGAGALF